MYHFIIICNQIIARDINHCHLPICMGIYGHKDYNGLCTDGWISYIFLQNGLPFFIVIDTETTLNGGSMFSLYGNDVFHPKMSCLLSFYGI